MGLIWRLIVSTQMRTSVNAVAGSEYAMIPYNGMRRERCSDYFVHHLHVADEENEVSSSDDESEEEVGSRFLPSATYLLRRNH